MVSLLRETEYGIHLADDVPVCHRRYDATVQPAMQRRAFLIDAVLAAALFCIALLSLVDLPQLADSRPLDVFGVVLIAVQTLTLAWRRRYPVAVLVIVVGAMIVALGFQYPTGWAAFGTAVALYTVAAQLDFRRSLVMGGVAIVIVLIWTLVGVVTIPLPVSTLATMFGFLVFPFILGREERKRERRALEYEARAVRAELDRERKAAEAVRREQARIARELHDAVAHEVTVMTVQAAAAGRVLHASPPKAREAIRTVEESGHRALTEMRRLLTLLRSGAKAELGPQPGLADLDMLVDQFAIAGLDVALSVEGEPRQVPIGVDVNAYRIVQESLTNTIKHGGPEARAGVVVRYGQDALTVIVDDDGRGAAEGLAMHRPGQGIAGMRERVSLVDGTLDIGPRPGGGYRVHVHIPLEDA